MSLIKQLWLSLLIIVIVAFGGTCLISSLGARNYLEQQLHLKNQDNAASLALAITQLEKDPVTVELLVNAHFDSGHYRQIRLTDPSGEILLELANPPADYEVPSWFIELVAIQVDAGVAQIQDGWQQYATLTLYSHDRFAYQELWRGSQRLAIWFVCGLFACGLGGSFIIRRITRPVGEIVAQAEAIGERRFVTVAEPATQEFRRIVRAMNSLSARVKAMLEEEAERLEKLRFAAHYDLLTGALDRQHFIDTLESLLDHEETRTGSLVIGRLAGLDELNRQLGRQVVDQILVRVGERLKQLLADRPDWLVGRLAGADFALLAPEVSDTLQVAQLVATQLHLAADEANLEGERLLPVGGTLFEPGEAISAVLSRADGALIMAEREADLAVQVTAPSAKSPVQTDLVSWRQALSGALERNDVKLAEYPVLDRENALLHHEAPVRLRIDGDWQTAATFIPWVARLGLMPQLDTAVILTALTELSNRETCLGINLSGEALSDPAFRQEALRALEERSEVASRLWLEIPESAAFRQLREFRSLCREFKSYGCKVGLEHVGSHFSRINELHDLGLDFIKIDAALIRGATSNPASQAFLRGLCTIAHAIGLQVIAEGVREENEPACLIDLGFDGMTGPGVREKS